ncbi:MAG: hypothetical protein A2792_16700 [Sphingomonadales bacterium RIFCSPHIGHO2_01_FULL_65_20]|jgi:hypothetical protein|uniref:hypothetical protein n=1 Tax=unclassified Blastomonas TaxID=2626550 RepID=UPI0008316412|nr:hypothetical protein [Blastomonas sp.]OHC92411.1 MAG: hypothetical protein A2792_16700 [Sphingomonadales bacterium RIFCSPHIGHO2_01_FULL_65_20]
MTDQSIRFFESSAAVRHLGERLIASCLPRGEWTHEAHVAACYWLAAERPDICLSHDLPDIIRRHNDSVGTPNTDNSGFHATITHCYAMGVAAFHRRCDPALALVERVNALLTEPEGARDWPLRFYSRERLFSVEARRAVILPDLAPLPG